LDKTQLNKTQSNKTKQFGQNTVEQNKFGQNTVEQRFNVPSGTGKSWIDLTAADTIKKLFYWTVAAPARLHLAKLSTNSGRG
jgi:hypothetical protein